MRLFFMLGLLLTATYTQAACLFSDSLAATLDERSVISLYQSCAEGMNDDAAQARLAAIYEKGGSTVLQDLKKAMYYYQLSAENGNANSQARLAQLYMQFDKGKSNRAFLYNYMGSIAPVQNTTQKSGAKTEPNTQGGLLHPYVLLMLANEKPENKWYYPTNVIQAPPYAAKLLKEYKIDEEKKKQLTRQATQWKKRKLLEAARQILPAAEYQDFVNTLYPTSGQPDTFKRKELLKSFQEKVKIKKQQDAASAKTLY